MAARTGGLLLGITTTVKLRVALNNGMPLSVTITLNAFEPVCAGVGVQVNTPFVGLMAAFAAAPLPRLNANWPPSDSEAILVIMRAIPTAMVWLVIAARTGGLLVGVTITAKVRVAVKAGKPLSVTTTLKLFVPLCACVGVHVKTPVAGLMSAPAAAPVPRLNVN